MGVPPSPPATFPHEAIGFPPSPPSTIPYGVLDSLEDSRGLARRGTDIPVWVPIAVGAGVVGLILVALFSKPVEA